MFSSIWDDLKREYEYGNMVSRLVIINVGIFFAYCVIYFLIYLFTQGKGQILFENFISSNFALPTDLRAFIWKPWSLFTHFFLHQGFGHILWNMVSLYFFGTIFGDLLGDQRVLPLYILGGLAGAITIFISKLFLPNIGEYALGASASIMAIVLATGLKAPNYLIRLILIGDVKLKYIVLVIILLDMIGASSVVNSGGHLAHLGGAFMGYLYTSNLNNGRDLAAPVNRILDKIILFYQTITGKNKKKPTVAHRNFDNPPRERKKQNTNGVSQDKIDKVLEKIKEKGYDSLSDEEKQMLFNASREKKS
jgi:membrane associated rhomboid family serine protease